jgi:hypothetical protein
MSIYSVESKSRGGFESSASPKKTGLIRDESQEDKAIKLFVAASRRAEWITARELSEQVSLQYSRVIWCLRKRGFKIENRVETRNGVRHGYFRLVVPEAPAKKASAKPEPQPHTLNLFSPSELEGARRNYVDPEEVFG